MQDSSWLDKFDQLQKKTAQFPIDQSQTYLPLGICDEFSEYMEKMLDDRPDNELIGELGDVWWYVIGHWTTNLGRRASAIHSEFPTIYTIGTSYSPDEQFSRDYHRICMRAGMFAGLIAGRAKKIIRDGEMQTKINQSYELTKQLISTLLRIMNYHRVTFESLFLVTEEKLLNRLSTGTIKGDGDRR